MWRLAKRVFVAIRAEGVDLADDAAVDAWAAEFSEAPAERRRAVLGVLPDRQPELLTCQFVIRDGLVAAIAPGTPVPPQFRRHDPDTCPECLEAPANPRSPCRRATNFADTARGSALMRKMVACGRWVAAGRAVTRQGFPRQPTPGHWPRPWAWRSVAGDTDPEPVLAVWKASQILP